MFQKKFNFGVKRILHLTIFGAVIQEISQKNVESKVIGQFRGVFSSDFYAYLVVPISFKCYTALNVERMYKRILRLFFFDSILKKSDQTIAPIPRIAVIYILKVGNLELEQSSANLW